MLSSKNGDCTLQKGDITYRNWDDHLQLKCGCHIDFTTEIGGLTSRLIRDVINKK